MPEMMPPTAETRWADSFLGEYAWLRWYALSLLFIDIIIHDNGNFCKMIFDLFHTLEFRNTL